MPPSTPSSTTFTPVSLRAINIRYATSTKFIFLYFRQNILQISRKKFNYFKIICDFFSIRSIDFPFDYEKSEIFHSGCFCIELFSRRPMSIINLVSINNNAYTMHPRSFSRNITDSYTMWQFPATVKMMKWNGRSKCINFRNAKFIWQMEQRRQRLYFRLIIIVYYLFDYNIHFSNAHICAR